MTNPEICSTGGSLSREVTLSSLDTLEDEKILVLTLSFEIGTNE